MTIFIARLAATGILGEPPKRAQNYRQFSPRYNESISSDLTLHKQRQIDRKTVDWLMETGSYASKLYDEYYRTFDENNYSAELTSIQNTELEHWFVRMSADDIIIGAADGDQLFPANELFEHSVNRGGVRRFALIKGANHNVHHFHPQKASEFAYRSFGIGQLAKPSQ